MSVSGLSFSFVQAYGTRHPLQSIPVQTQPATTYSSSRARGSADQGLCLAAFVTELGLLIDISRNTPHPAGLSPKPLQLLDIPVLWDYTDSLCTAHQESLPGAVILGEDLGSAWVSVSQPHPHQYHVLAVFYRDAEGQWQYAAVQLETAERYAALTHLGGQHSMAYHVGFRPSCDCWLGAGAAAGQQLCILTMVARCRKGCWHQVAQFQGASTRDATITSICTGEWCAMGNTAPGEPPGCIYRACSLRTEHAREQARHSSVRC